MRRAHDDRARFVAILGEEEMTRGTVTIRRMSDGRQESVGEADVEQRLLEWERA